MGFYIQSPAGVAVGSAHTQVPMLVHICSGLLLKRTLQYS